MRKTQGMGTIPPIALHLGMLSLQCNVHWLTFKPTFSGVEQPPSKKKSRKGKAVFMTGVPGVQVFTEEPKMRELQIIVQRMCKWKG